MAAIDAVKAARAPGRPSGGAYIQNMVADFIELHGDRRFKDDAAVIGGIGRIGPHIVTAIALEKGEDTKERVRRNFGSAHPEGYRKALRLMKQAEKFRRPVILFVDTAGAFCGIGAEQRGQGQAIAENLMEMMALSVPVIAVFTGEGGSGGALALAVANEVWMLENAVYSVISPEGCASILWKDAGKTAEAAECLKLTAQDLYALKVIEKVIPEGDFETVYACLRGMLIEKLTALCAVPPKELKESRYQRFRKMGEGA